MTATIDRTTSKTRSILMVVANPAVSEMTGWPIGFWAAEMVHPWYAFREVGYEVTLASPDGGKVQIDALSDPRDEGGYSAYDVLSMGFLNMPELTAMWEDTPKLSELDLDAFDAIVVCGGQAPMYQFRGNADLQSALAHFYTSEKPTAALCHGVSALIDLKVDGSYLIEGRTMTGFSNVEEDASNEAAGMTVQPWRIEDAARERGANYVEGGLWKAFAVRDGRLITGQQQYSGAEVAKLVTQALGV
jgi:putative intracellular protease/amidase